MNNEIITTFDILNEIKYLVALNEELINSEKNEIYEIAQKSLIRQKIRQLK